MGTDLATNETFQAGIKKRLRKDIGKLMPDSVLTEMIEKSMKEVFFTKTTSSQSQSYGSPKITTTPSWFETEVGSLLEEKMRNRVKLYMSTNSDKIDKEITQYIKNKTPEVIGACIASVIKGGAENLEITIRNIIQNNY